jgi:hypothetical protein
MHWSADMIRYNYINRNINNRRKQHLVQELKRNFMS